MSLAAGLLLVLIGCQGTPSADAETGRTLRIFAASSLIDVLRDLENHYEARHPGVDVSVSTGGSQILRHQIAHGAPAHVFLSANREHVGWLAEEGLLEAPRVIAHNRLAVIVPRDNPAGITSLADLPKAQRLVLGSNEVPIGAYSRSLIIQASTFFGPDYASKVLDSVVSEESSVRLVRAKVALGEADAAIVYQTDVRGLEALQAIPLPTDLNIRADYLGGVSTDRLGREEGVRWLDFLATTDGQHILNTHGFDTPG